MIPTLGLGTWQMSGHECVEAVRHGLELGYRHVDTAEMYGNEREVGEGIRLAGVDRDELFVASKVWHDHLAYDQVLGTIDKSLERLGLEHLDLMYIHWPSPNGTPISETLEALMEARSQGLIRRIGVSNFPPALVQQAVKVAEIAALQVEHHPFLRQEELLKIARANAMTLVSYSPLARGKVLDHPVITDIAARRMATPAQVTLAWLLAKPGCAAIPKASTAEHRQDNWAARKVPLTPEDLERIDGIEESERLIDPSFAPNWSAGARA